ncbi:MAG: GNAT family N-acetyltransferase [Peptostreptococcaceae bacterium]|jgi:hypothetical protein|nr:GNAT family N-acetyltransferase [Peptostreptococcaceae bacterium]
MNIRNLKSCELKEASNLINEVFRFDRNEKPTMTQEFPLLLNENNIKRSVGLFVDSKLVSIANNVVLDIHLPNTLLKGAFVGAVCTHKDYESNGYSSKVLDVVESNLKKEKIDFVSISGTRTLYTRRKLIKANSFYEYKLVDKKKYFDLPNHKLIDFDDEYLEEILASYNQNSTRFKRTKKELEILLDSATTPLRNYSYKKFIIVDKNNMYKGYIIIRLINDNGKTHAKVIESCGVNLLINLFLYQILVKYDLEYINYFAHSKDYNNLLSSYEEKKITNIGGTIKIVDYISLMNKLRNYFGSLFDFSDELEFDFKEENYYIRCFGEEIKINGIDNITRLVFEGANDDLINNIKNKKLKRFIEKSFPIPFVSTEGLNYQ